ncbi:MAG: TRIC cation channel family protein, partial [Ilumatobacteraceae bacterium]
GLGTLTADGGGVARDILLDRVPLILRTDIYAVAALAGATVFVLGVRRVPRELMMVLGGLTCFALRIVAYHYDWNLPARST